tara:strand:+ start:203 stop:898 length:696 start_codon:yes stop_codon:yes gene_type:complete
MTTSDSKIIALLPMKANSERVKGKNFKYFGGKPLFKWILETLISIELIDEIVINTDAINTIESFGLINNKITLRDRKKSICGDDVSMNKVIHDDIKNTNADIYIMTHTTNPLLTSNTIKKAIDIYKEKIQDGYDSVFTVNKIQTRFYDTNCMPINHNPKILQKTQDLELWYEENSNLYIFSKESFKKSNARIGINPWMIESEKFESIDIDTTQDWKLAEAILEGSKKIKLL